MNQLEPLIFNRDFELIGIIDGYKSFIWTERRLGYGEFELYLPMSLADFSILQINNYISVRDSNAYMIIETIEIETDAEEGASATISGRSLESILDRRIFWDQFVYEGPFQAGIEEMLNQCLINPSVSGRKIDNFTFVPINGPISIINAPVSWNFYGDNLYDVIYSACETLGTAFSVTINSEKEFVFKLLVGVDRSYNQETNPYVVFSPSFENLSGSNFLESYKLYKNYYLISGEEDDDGAIMSTMAMTELSTGLDRREFFDDATEVKRSYDKEAIEAADMDGIEYVFKEHVSIDENDYVQGGFPVSCRVRTQTFTQYGIDTVRIVDIQAGDNNALWTLLFWPMHNNKAFEWYARESKDQYETVIPSGWHIAEQLADGIIYTPCDPPIITVTVDNDVSGIFKEWLLENSSPRLDKDTYISQIQTHCDTTAIPEHVVETDFEGNLDVNSTYEYGVDYAIGDVVQVMNEYGMSRACKVSEVVRSSDTSDGNTLNITFEAV